MSRMDEYIRLEKNYLAYRADYQKICAICGHDSFQAEEMWAVVQDARDKLMAVNESILNKRINYWEDEDDEQA